MQKRILEWMPHNTQSGIPDYLDWTFDVPEILLNGIEETAR